MSYAVFCLKKKIQPTKLSMLWRIRDFHATLFRASTRSISFSSWSVDHRVLHSFPTRRSSDLDHPHEAGVQAVLHIPDEDALFDQHRPPRRRPLVVDVERAATVRDQIGRAHV